MRPKYFANQEKQTEHYVFELLKMRQDKELSAALEIAQKSGTPPLQVTPLDGRHLELLARTIQPQKILEIGTLCGYSTIFLARALKTGGKVYTCERSAHHAQTAQKIFQHLGIEHKVEVVFGDAGENLPKLQAHGPFDLIFLDADKQNYPNYYEWAVSHLRPGGLLVADNVFVFDHITKEKEHIENPTLQKIVDAMREFNEKCANDKRLFCTILPTGEGLLVALKKPVATEA